MNLQLLRIAAAQECNLLNMRTGKAFRERSLGFSQFFHSFCEKFCLTCFLTRSTKCVPRELPRRGMEGT